MVTEGGTTMEKKIIELKGAKEKDINALYKEFSSSEQGLSDDEAIEKLAVYGYNEITEKN
jgi:hypothetical protein